MRVQEKSLLFSKSQYNISKTYHFMKDPCVKVIYLKKEVSMCAFLLVIRELVFPYADFHIEHIMTSKRVVLI